MPKTKQTTIPVVKENKIKKLIEVDKLEVNNLPDGVQVATMCSSCKIGTKIDLDNIEKFMTLNENDVLAIKRSRENLRSLVSVKKQTKRNVIKMKKNAGTHFYNQITIIMRVTDGPSSNLDNEPQINIKLFKNGSIQMSGCKTIDNVNTVLNKLIARLGQVKGKMENGQIKEISFVEEVPKLGIHNFKIDMIYCNYRITIQVDREKLYDLLTKKKVKCIYEPCIRACVIIKFTPKGDNEDNKEVSIFIFKKGNIIITGARSKKQVIEAYNYINDIIITHADEIVKKSEEYEEDLILHLYKDVLNDAEKGLVEIKDPHDLIRKNNNTILIK
jgi:TATA-box binding protein (TBP) (component of TFIID and TFIIIB)